MIDADEAPLRYLKDRFDLHTLCGDASHPSVLEQAGAMEADMMLAVTRND